MNRSYRRDLNYLHVRATLFLALVLSFGPVLPSLNPLKLFGALDSKASVLMWDAEGSDQSWFTKENWSENRIPTSDDIVTFDVSTSKDVVIVEDVSVAGLEIRKGYEGTIEVLSGKRVTIGKDGFRQDGGKFKGSGAPVNIFGSFFLHGGSFVAPSSNLTIKGNASFLGGEFIHNGGTVILNGIEQILFGNPTFYSLEKISQIEQTLVIQSQKTIRTEGTLRLKGTKDELLAIRPTEQAGPVIFDPQGAVDLQFLNLKNVINLSPKLVRCSPQCVNSGAVSGIEIDETIPEDTTSSQNLPEPQQSNGLPLLKTGEKIKDSQFFPVGELPQLKGLADSLNQLFKRSGTLIGTSMLENMLKPKTIGVDLGASEFSAANATDRIVIKSETTPNFAADEPVRFVLKIDPQTGNVLPAPVQVIPLPSPSSLPALPAPSPTVFPPSPSPQATITSSPQPSALPTQLPSEEPTLEPSPSSVPIVSPAVSPSPEPSPSLTGAPSPSPEVSGEPLLPSPSSAPISMWSRTILTSRSFFHATISLLSPSSAHAQVNPSPDTTVQETVITDASGQIVSDAAPEIAYDDAGNPVITIPKRNPNAFKPGKYTLAVAFAHKGQDVTVNQDFTWGVLAVNADKSSYTPGEEATIGIGVLGDTGKTICNASVTVLVKSPNGAETTYSTLSSDAESSEGTSNNTVSRSQECGEQSVTDLPDYSVKFVTAQEGLYDVTVSAEHDIGTRQLTRSLLVDQTSKFITQRLGSMRIYPSVGYTMKVRLKANEAFTGQIIEAVPTSFDISEWSLNVGDSLLAGHSDMIMKESEGTKELISPEVNIEKGQTVVLQYTYDAPDISPQFYLLGPLTLNTNDAAGEANEPAWTEPRTWHIAADSVSTDNLLGYWKLDDYATSVIDDEDASHSFTGTWTEFSDGARYNSDAYFNAAGAGSDKSTWTFTVTAGDTYKVATQWTENANRATDAPFTIYDNVTSLGTFDLNQENAPNDFNYLGKNWEYVTTSTFAISSGTLKVELTDNANEYVVADAVVIQKVITDSSDAGNSGKPVGDLANKTTGLPSAISFTNTAAVTFDGGATTADPAAFDVGEMDTLEGDSTVTLSAWVNIAAWCDCYIFAKDATNGDFIFTIWSDQKLYWQISGTTNRAISTAAPFSLSTWTHLAATYDGTTLTIYVNGVANGTGTKTTTVPTDTTNLGIGGDGDGANQTNNMDGDMDDMRVYDRTLSTTEITDLKNGSHLAATWDGSSSSNWETGANWDINAVPDNYTRITVADVTTQPALTANVETNNLTINSGATLDLDTYNLTMNDSGTFTNNGTLYLKGGNTLTSFTNDTDTGTVMYNGTSSYTGLPTSSYYDLFFNDSLIGYWKLDETAANGCTGGANDSCDSSGYGNDGAWQADATTSTTVPTVNFTDGRSVTFDGTGDYINAGDINAMDGVNKLTLSAWMYRSSTSNQVIITKASNASTSRTSLTMASDNNIYFNISNGSSTYGNVSFSGTGWHHIAMVYDGTQSTNATKLLGYVDGVQQTLSFTGTIPTTTASNSANLEIGAITLTPAYSTGNIDDLRLYNKVLTANEIAAMSAGNQSATGTGTFTLEDALDVNGDLILNTAILDTKSGENNAITVGQEWNNNGGIFTPRSGTVTLDGSSSSQELQSGGQNFNNLTISGSGSWVLHDRLEIDGTYSQSAGTLDVDSSKNYKIVANDFDQTAGTFTARSGTVTLNSSSNQTVNFTSALYNFQVEDPTENGLIGYWKFDEGQGSTTSDKSGNSNTGTLTNGPVWSATLPSTITFDNPHSMNFDGVNDYINATDINAMDGVNKLTLSAWMYRSSTSNQVIITKASNASTSRTSLTMASDNNIYFNISNGSSTYGNVAFSGTGWHHIAMVYDGAQGTNATKLLGYVDGVQQTLSFTGTIPTTTASNSAVLEIGAITLTPAYMTGNLDDVRLYDRVLSATEITNLNNGKYADGDNSTATFTLNKALDVDNDLFIQAGILDASTANCSSAPCNTTVGRDWNNYAGTSGFTARTSTVTFDGTNQAIRGSTTFSGFSKSDGIDDATDRTLTFQVSETQTITGTWTLNGLDATDRVNLVSSSPATQWNVDPSGTRTIDFVDVTDSNNIYATAVDASDNGVDGGNNTNWCFSSCGFTQNDFRWYVDSDAENVTDPWGNPNIAENTAIQVVPVSNDAPATATELRIRMNITTGGALAASAQAFKLQYGAGANCSSIGTWPDVGAAGGLTIWRFATSSVTGGTDLTASKLASTDVLEEYSKANASGTNPNSLTAGQDMEWDWHIENNGAQTGFSYCFRMVKSDGTALTTYNSDSYPRVEPKISTFEQMRHGNVFVGELEKGFTFAN